jgi:hypothetical protein
MKKNINKANRKFYQKKRYIIPAILIAISCMTPTTPEPIAPTKAVKVETVKKVVTPVKVIAKVTTPIKTTEIKDEVQNEAFQTRSSAVIQKSINDKYNGKTWEGTFISIYVNRSTKGNIFLEVYTTLNPISAKDGSADVANILSEQMLKWDIVIMNTSHKIIDVKIIANDGSTLNN